MTLIDPAIAEGVRFGYYALVSDATRSCVMRANR